MKFDKETGILTLTEDEVKRAFSSPLEYYVFLIKIAEATGNSWANILIAEMAKEAGYTLKVEDLGRYDSYTDTFVK